MSVWPQDPQRAMWLMMLLMIVSGTVYACSIGVALYTSSMSDLLSPEVWRFVWTFLLGGIFWSIKKGYKLIVGRFDTLNDAIRQMGERQHAFIYAMVQLTAETHPEMATQVLERFAPFLNNPPETE